MTFYSLIGIVVTSATVVIFGEPVWDPVQVIARSLKPGGRFVTANTNPVLAFPSAPCSRKDGFQTEAIGEWGEGTPNRWTFHLGDGSFTIEHYPQRGQSRGGVAAGELPGHPLAPRG